MRDESTIAASQTRWSLDNKFHQAVHARPTEARLDPMAPALNHMGHVPDSMR